MTKQDYDIHMASLDRCLEHLRTLDLADMAVSALAHGTHEDRMKIRMISQFVPFLPLDPPPFLPPGPR